MEFQPSSRTLVSSPRIRPLCAISLANGLLLPYFHDPFSEYQQLEVIHSFRLYHFLYGCTYFLIYFSIFLSFYLFSTEYIAATVTATLPVAADFPSNCLPSQAVLPPQYPIDHHEYHFDPSRPARLLIRREKNKHEKRLHLP